MSMTPSRRKLEAFKLKHAAEDGCLLIYRCALCRRQRAFLATDVVGIWNPDMSVYFDGRYCSHCGKGDYVSVTIRQPSSVDIGKLMLRRPAGTRLTQLWKDEWYGL